jgi:hypothetical protein
VESTMPRAVTVKCNGGWSMVTVKG